MNWIIAFGVCNIIKLIEILIELNIGDYYGKLIFKVKNIRGKPVFWIIGAILCCTLIVKDSVDYIYYKQAIEIEEILKLLFFTQMAIHKIITERIYLNLTEKGIRVSEGFCKWSEVHSYEWIKDDVLKILIRKDKSLQYAEFEIQEEERWIVEKELIKAV
ncbi:DUF5673 domain-containing protein [Clostridium sp. ZS2-4]|uniref:DUF5673 domain-containing protein n=1 Tax=Clostridium sp. ZS2-4 TaxID=2987703 RepID=UPI00227CF3F6|nr:DUF5673 domain-containing protein [Clostridium sp. ZS2-4]MCY6356294.1 DUF5673 domain-containing protein [Clostridium sp. ZS2-4]